MRISTRDKNRVNGAAREQLTHGSLLREPKREFAWKSTRSHGLVTQRQIASTSVPHEKKVLLSYAGRIRKKISGGLPKPPGRRGRRGRTNPSRKVPMH